MKRVTNYNKLLHVVCSKGDTEFLGIFKQNSEYCSCFYCLVSSASVDETKGWWDQCHIIDKNLYEGILSNFAGLIYLSSNKLHIRINLLTTDLWPTDCWQNRLIRENELDNLQKFKASSGLVGQTYLSPLSHVCSWSIDFQNRGNNCKEQK